MNINNDEFYNIAEKCYKDRILEQEKLKNDISYVARLEYSLFCVWCNAFRNCQYSETNFKYYVRNIKNLSFWIKKKIAEMYFGYVYEFDYDTKKWNCTKIKTV